MKHFSNVSGSGFRSVEKEGDLLGVSVAFARKHGWAHPKGGDEAGIESLPDEAGNATEPSA
jgi:hypothetical protein